MSVPPLKSVARFLQIRVFSSSSFGLQFLAENCGIPINTNATRIRKIQFDEKLSSKVNAVVTCFKSHEFSEAEIAKLIEKDPSVLRCRVSTNLYPKLQYLVDIGVEGSVLRHIVLKNPDIFGKSLNATIKPSYEFLKTVLGSDLIANTVIRREPKLLTTTDLERRMKVNIDYLAQQGVSSDGITRLIRMRPIPVTKSNDKMVDWVARVKNLGLRPRDPVFVYGLRVMTVISECTWKRKVEMFKSLGWSDEDVVSTFSSRPCCFLLSEEKVKTSMEFYVKEMGIPREVVIARPTVLTYSLKETIRPRCSVVKVLVAEKLLCKWTLTTLLKLNEEAFIRNFVTKHLDRVPNLLEIYKCNKI